MTGQGSGQGREVVIRLKLGTDEAANQATARSVVTNADKVQTQLTAKAKAGAAERWAVEKENLDRVVDESVKAAKRADSAAAKAHADQMKRQRMLQTATERASELHLQRQIKLTGAVLSTGKAAAGLARGFAMIGAASEEDLEKAIRALAKIEGGIQIVMGITAAVRAGSEAWKAYRAHVLAAAAAEKLLGRGGAGMAGKAATGALGRVAGGMAGQALGMAGGAAGAAGGGAAASSLAGVSGAAVAGITGLAAAAVTAAGALAILGEGAYNARTGRTKTPVADSAAGMATTATRFATAVLPGGYNPLIERGIGMTPLGDFQASGRAQAQTAKMQAERIAMLQEQARREDSRAFLVNQSEMDYGGNRGDSAGARARIGRTGAGADIAEATARLAELRSRRDAIEKGAGIGPGGRGADSAAAAEFRAKAIREELGLQQQLHDARLAEHQEQLGEIDERISKTRTAKQAAEDLFRTEQQRLLTAEQRLAALNPLEAAALKGAVGKLQAGQDVSRRELDLVRGVGLYDDKVQEQDRKRVSALGLDGLLAEQRGKVGAAAVESAKLSLQLATELTASVKLEDDAESLAAQLAKQLLPLLEQKQKAEVDAVRAEFERSRAARTAQTGAGG